MPKILHISNDYAGSTVYMNLIRELDGLGVEQMVYSPIRDKALTGKNAIVLKKTGSKIIYSAILNRHIDRILYPYKVLKICRDIQKKIDFTQIDFIHAHTWFSDGGVAYFLAKKYNIPFIVTVRSTDLNTFYKKLAYLRPFGRQVLEQAQNVILISASSKPKLLQVDALKKILTNVKDKVRTIPNGVDRYWIDNYTINKNHNLSQQKCIHLVYVGTFIARKKLFEIQQAVIELNKNTDAKKAHLHIVGGGGDNEAKVLMLVQQYPEYFTFHGRVTDKEKLLRLYRSSDIFVMPSLYETFGLVYIEAMLQGLPVLYTVNDGIDGFYSENIGEKVKTASVEEIVEKLSIMMENLNHYRLPTIALIQNHNWTEIAKLYLSIYQMSL